MTKSKVSSVPSAESFSIIPSSKLLAIYSAMLQSRQFVEQAIAQLPRQRVPKSLDAVLGHEAAVVAAAIDLKQQDALVPTLWPGDALRSINSAPTILPTIPAAIRAAIAQKDNHRIMLVFSSSRPGAQAAWHKALTVAAQHRLPILFLSLNHASTREPSLNPHGLPVMTVDGNDAVAVYRVATESMTYARKGYGPTLIDCSLSIPADPLKNMHQYLVLKGHRPARPLKRNSIGRLFLYEPICSETSLI